MSESFALALFVVAVVLAGSALVGVARGVAGARLRTGLAGLGLGLAIQAVGHGIAMLAGHHAARPVLQCAYLAVSVAIVPVGLALAAPRDSVDEPDRWVPALLGMVAVISAVLVLRVQTTWRPGHG